MNNTQLNTFYKNKIIPYGSIAILNEFGKQDFISDKYHSSIKGFEFHYDLKLNKKYNTIICKKTINDFSNPFNFLKKCKENLKNNGVLYIDWYLTLCNIKEYCFNHYSMVWDDSFLNNEQYIQFKKEFSNYRKEDLKGFIFNNVKNIIKLTDIQKIFVNVEPYLIHIEGSSPELIVLLKCN